jgi:hypothetical protein
MEDFFAKFSNTFAALENVRDMRASIRLGKVLDKIKFLPNRE